VINPSQRPVPDKTQHSQQTNIHATGGIRTHNLSRRAAEDLRLRPRGHWDRPFTIVHWVFMLLTPRIILHSVYQPTFNIPTNKCIFFYFIERICCVDILSKYSDIYKNKNPAIQCKWLYRMFWGGRRKQTNSTSEADTPSGKCNILTGIITLTAAANEGPLTHLTGVLPCLYKHNHFLPPKQSDTAELQTQRQGKYVRIQRINKP
jgi:hypothetical protein